MFEHSLSSKKATASLGFTFMFMESNYCTYLVTRLYLVSVVGFLSLFSNFYHYPSMESGYFFFLSRYHNTCFTTSNFLYVRKFNWPSASTFLSQTLCWWSIVCSFITCMITFAWFLFFCSRRIRKFLLFLHLFLIFIARISFTATSSIRKMSYISYPAEIYPHLPDLFQSPRFLNSFVLVFSLSFLLYRARFCTVLTPETYQLSPNYNFLVAMYNKYLYLWYLILNLVRNVAFTAVIRSFWTDLVTVELDDILD